MAKWIDKTNMKFGKLTAIKYLGNKKWLCECECGNLTIVNSDHLPMKEGKRGTFSCGCGLKSRLTKNINYFNVVDSEGKAYFLGLVASDGTISYKNSCQLKIVLTKNDYSILEKFKQELNSSVEIKFFTNTTKLPQGTQCTSDFCSILICSKEIIEDLIRYGITPRKSHTLKFNYNLLPNEYLKDFLRGMWDGDGSFTLLKKRNLLEVNLTTNYEMAVLTKNKILEIFPEFHIGIYPTKINPNTVRMIFTKQEDSKKFLDYLYCNSNFYLDRKYFKYQEIKSLLY